MKRDVIEIPSRLNSSFLSCEKDTQTILEKLFVKDRIHAETLKRLLVISAEDCLDATNEKYNEKIKEYTVKKLIDEGYITLVPKIRFKEHEEVKTYIAISFDNFTMNETNPEFRDCTVNFDIFCHTDYWDVKDYRLRPVKICGYIDALLNNCKLSGIGLFHFIGCSQIVLNEDLSGYTLSYRAVHGTDDILEEDPQNE